MTENNNVSDVYDDTGQDRAPRKQEIRTLSSHYRSGSQNLGKDFFETCFRHCTRYSRAAGYFSSTALVAWFGGLTRLLSGEYEIKIRLLASYQLSNEDAEALRRATDPAERKRILERTSTEMIDYLLCCLAEQDQDTARLELFAWLIAKEHIELKFAHPVENADSAIFHEKIGVFEFPWGDAVAFTGSANETGSGHTRNYESIDVYRSWVQADEMRVQTKCQQFEEAWEGRAQGLEVVPLSDQALDRIRQVAPTRRPPAAAEASPVYKRPNRWAHQDDAIAAFLDAKRGILEMATGTGKTRTALRILTTLLGNGEIESAIVTTDGNDLLSQWCDEIEGWPSVDGSPLLIFRHFEQFGEIGRFVMTRRPNTVIVLSRRNLPALFRRLPQHRKERMAIVHDEVHGLGQPSLHEPLHGQHAAFPYVLGLSATPERAYDADGNRFIEQEVGSTIFEFPLERAIENGVLCEFNYTPLDYELTDGDRERIRQVFRRASAAKHQGRSMSEQDIWIEISKVYKTAEMKIPVFSEYLRQQPEVLHDAILFVETMEYGEELLPILHQFTSRYRTYYSGDDQSNLNAFASGEIDCLLTCHRLSQGVDIRSLTNVILFASARSKLETIQRIGRCLRVNPNNPSKRANVVDFVRPQDEEEEIPNADTERCEWLKRISRYRRREVT